MNPRRLLQAAYEVHCERRGSRMPAGTALDMDAAAERLGVIPGTPPYNTAAERLENEGAIEANPITESVVGGTQYIVTERGREILGRE